MRIILPTLLLLILPLPVTGLEAPSLATGKTLFETPYLGTRGKSCAGCHPQGEGLTHLETVPDAELAEIINRCIRQPLAGTPLDPDSTEMASLILYLRSLPTATP